MSEHNFKITGYSVHLGERVSFSAETPEGKKKQVLITAVITCRGDKGERLMVHFYENGGPLKSTSHLEEGKIPSGSIFEPQSAYRDYVDLLRNESPIWGYIEIGEKVTDVKIYTGKWEPVGAGDEDYSSDPFQ